MENTPFEKIKNLQTTGLFKMDENGFADLIGTNFYTYYSFVQQKLAWVEYYNPNVGPTKTVKLGYVLENVPEQIAEQLLYHLDLLT